MAMKSESKPITRSIRIDSVVRTSSKATVRNEYSRPFNSAQLRRRTSVTFDIESIREDESYTASNDKKSFRNPRRMSAPELPPIQDRAKNSPTQLTYQRRYIHTRSNRQSNTSDNSQSGYLAKSPYSQGSSESNQSNGVVRKVTNGLISRSKTWVTPDQTSTESNDNSVSTLKLEAILSKKNGMSTHTPRSTKNGFRSRVSSKDLSTSSGNNNTSQMKQHLKHCKSDSRIQPIENYTTNRTKKFIKRHGSDQKLKDGHNNKINRVLSIEKTDSLTRNHKNNGTVNGMRRYSSTIQLNPQRVDDDQYDDDSGSDSDKDQMIMSWLIGVESEDPENPPDPEFEYPDEPPQTDTAVHIVYEGDS